MSARLPKDEVNRLQALQECAVLNTAPEGVFDDVTGLAARLLRMPISLVSLVDETRQWFKSRHGLDIEHTSRAWSFCAHAILAPGEVFEVPDARDDPRFADNPLVVSEPFIRFYAGTRNSSCAAMPMSCSNLPTSALEPKRNSANASKP
jgi:GAF domain-containing protein